MANRYVHTCIRVRDPEASERFYEALGFERRGRLNFETAYNVYMGLPGEGDVLELTVNRGHNEPYDLGTGYNHIALTVDDIDDVLATLKPLGVQPEKPPYRPGGREDLPIIAFVADPDGYRIELIEGSAFRTPQDPSD
ncbi:MAG: VOC family protein [Solirubrobacterales bacterium]|nr:VOC family protein [Solirubrobacterales bacterium]